MTLPIPSKSWTFNCNNAIAAQGSVTADCQALLLAIVNALLATGKWTVAYSCNSVTAGTAGDGVNRWSSATNLVWASGASAHSWIVLKNTNMPGGNYQLCIDLNTSVSQAYTLVAIRSINAGFTGGSTTTRPTATDQITLLNSATWGAPSADQAMRWSTEVSTDGQCTRVITAFGGAVRGLWYFEQTSNSDAGTTYPVGDVLNGSNGAFAPSLIATSIFPLAGISGTASIGYVSQLTALTSPSSINSNWPIVPASLIGTTAGAFGYLGMFQDLWVGSASVASGDSYPGASNWAASTIYALNAQVTNGSNVYTCTTAGTSASSGGPTGTGTGITDGTCVWNFFSQTLKFVQIGQLIIPWNGGAFNLT